MKGTTQWLSGIFWVDMWGGELKKGSKSVFIRDPQKMVMLIPKQFSYASSLGKPNRKLIAGKPERSNSFLSLSRNGEVSVYAGPPPWSLGAVPSAV